MSKNETNGSIPILELQPGSSVRNVIAVMSGKGGVGKSTTSALIAVGLAMQGYRVGLLDADITGPSIPRMFGLKGPAEVKGNTILPMQSHIAGIKVMSLNLLLDHDDQPVLWRGPLLAGAVRQFWTDVAWGELDYLIVDLPPGTGDVPLTVLQSLPVTGIVIVSSPQELSLMVVRKAIHMAEAMNVPILGLLENFSYAICPSCNEKHYLFGPSKAVQTADASGLRFLGALPIDATLAEHCDKGTIELYKHVPDVMDWMSSLRDADKK